MQKYFTQWGHHLYPLDGEQHPNETGYYLVSDADARIEQLERALKSCAAVLKLEVKERRVFERVVDDALAEADKALALMDTTHMAKRITWKKRLEPFGELIYQMSQQVHDMNPRDLLQLENACKKVSTTNIGWGSYEASKIVAGLARDERYRRKAASAQGKEGGQ